MDRRTILFILLVSVTFIGFNFFFGWQRDQKNRQLIQEKEAKAAHEKALAGATLQTRTASLADLPLVSLYLSANETSPVTQGLLIGGNVLVVAWDTHLPSTLFVNGKEVTLSTPSSVKGGPALYQPSSPQSLEIASLPSGEVVDAQLITFPHGASPEVVVGEYEGGSFTPLQTGISENGFVLYKTPNGYLPLGFYISQDHSFVLLEEFPLFTLYLRPYAAPSLPQVTKEQKYYLLENAYQQLVFSNVGGALVEINLPFHTNKESVSVVNEIGFDREIATESPANGRFPAHSYYTPNAQEAHSPGPVGGYYPLLRRGLFAHPSLEIAPQFTALNIVSEYPETAQLVYEVKSFTAEKIVFEARQPHRKITKTYTLAPGSSGAPYCLDLELQIEGDSRGLWLTSGVPEVEIMSNSSSPLIQYRMNRKGKSEVEKLSLPKVGEVVSVSSVSPDWVVDSNGYLGMIMDPLDPIGGGYKAFALPGNEVPTRLSVLNPQNKPYPASKYPGYQVLLPLPPKGGTFHFRIYSGPFEEGVLKKVDALYTDPATGENPDYLACRTFYGWFSFISKPFAKLLFIVMKFFHTLTNSWGLSIILLTLFLRILLYPLNSWSIKSMRRMQKLSPYIQAIQAKHKKEPKKAQIEIMALYREKKVNPFTGCIPILIQIPFLIAMFDLLKSSFQLRGASFIPGWIDNLTAPDVLFQWQTPFFFIGNQFHLLPVLLGVVMFIQQRLSTQTPQDPSKMTDQQRQQKAMGTIMTVVFTVMFYHFPSGLNLYWLSSMLLGILQQVVTNKIMDKKKTDEIEIIPKPTQKKLATKKVK